VRNPFSCEVQFLPDETKKFLELKFETATWDNFHHLTLARFGWNMFLSTQKQTSELCAFSSHFHPPIRVWFDFLHFPWSELSTTTDLMLKATCTVLFLPQIRESQTLRWICIINAHNDNVWGKLKC
jgi:hypothetical protein